jgi:hypothetical protein
MLSLLIEFSSVQQAEAFVTLALAADTYGPPALLPHVDDFWRAVKSEVC